MKISIIAAMDKNRLIGKDGKLPWNVPDDLKRFKELTSNKFIVMGRKTYESIGKPLKDRFNVVISSYKKPRPGESLLIMDSIEMALKFIEAFVDRFKTSDEIMIIGGQTIYEQTIGKANKLYITEIYGDYEGDTWFPEFDIEKTWKLTSEEKHDTHSFKIYERV